MSALAFNLRKTIFATLYATQEEEAVTETRHFHISKNVSDKTEGMRIVITETQWNDLIASTTRGLASLLKTIANKVDMREYRKA